MICLDIGKCFARLPFCPWIFSAAPDGILPTLESWVLLKVDVGLARLASISGSTFAEELGPLVRRVPNRKVRLRGHHSTHGCLFGCPSQ